MISFSGSPIKDSFVGLLSKSKILMTFFSLTPAELPAIIPAYARM